MTDDDPLAPAPEGDLIRRARERAVPKISIRAASAQIGISPEHWGNIERGYKSVSSAEPPRRLAPASAALIAKMAKVIGVKPAELAAAGREDAARELQEMPSRITPPAPVSLERGPDDVFPDMTPAMRVLVDEQVPALEYLVREAADTGSLKGSRIFSDPHESARWDYLAELGYSPWQLIRLMAVGRVKDDERRAANGEPRRARDALSAPP